MASLFKWLRRLPFSPGRRLVGSDFAGNSYYEMPVGEGMRPRRVVYSDLDESTFENSSIPIQWNGTCSIILPMAFPIIIL
jgi:hypothetical protein